MKGKTLQKLLSESSSWRLDTYPEVYPETLEPETSYTVVAPEAILWAIKTIKNDWTDVQAGPDLLKAEIIEAFYGVSQ